MMRNFRRSRGSWVQTQKTVAYAQRMPQFFANGGASRRHPKLFYLTSASKFARRGYLETRPKVSGETTS